MTMHAVKLSENVGDAEMKPKYPHIDVRMVGEDGNAFAIIGRCLRQMRNAGCTQEQRDEFQSEVTAGDYNHLLCTVMNYFNVDAPPVDEDELDDIDEDELFDVDPDLIDEETEDETEDLKEDEETDDDEV
jgi:hypothetical protein